MWPENPQTGLLRLEHDSSSQTDKFVRLVCFVLMGGPLACHHMAIQLSIMISKGNAHQKGAIYLIELSSNFNYLKIGF